MSSVRAWLVLLFALALGLPAQPLRPPRGPQDPMFSPEDEKTLAGYLLDLGKLNRFEKATKALSAKVKTDQALRKEMEEDEAKEDGIARWIEVVATTKPVMVSVLKEAGLEPREFVLSSYALTLSMVHADLLKANPLNPLPTYVPRANLGFVRAQEDRLAALFKALAEDDDDASPEASIPNLVPGSPATPPTTPAPTPTPTEAK
ncbi:MAG: hypothetical protein JSR82_23150 [Verrucomicrobia bacterium]|nr:hypothetical protein [Verrucomicrobiota bacterium]